MSASGNSRIGRCGWVRALAAGAAAAGLSKGAVLTPGIVGAGLIEVARCVHAVVQHPNDGDAVIGHTQIDHVPLNEPAAMVWPDVRAV
jgi:hypothetical protein